jgi:predicted Zn-dependent protease
MTNSIQRIYPLLIALCLALLSGCFGMYGSGYSTSPTAPVYFAPVGTVSEEQLAFAQHYVKEKFGLDSLVLASITPDRYHLFDGPRNQLIAERALDKLRKDRGPALEGKKSIVIGIANIDMFLESKDWPYALTAREDTRMGLISIARVDPANEGERRKEALFHARFQKLLARNVSVLYYGRSENDNAKSALYAELKSIEELDAVERDF